MAHPPPSSLHSPQNRRTGRARFGRGDPSFRFSPWSLSRTTTLRPLAAFRHTRADKRKPKLTEAATNVRPRNGKSGARRLNISRLSDRSLKHTIHVFYKPCGHRKQYFRFFCLFFTWCGIWLSTLFSLACSFLNRVSPLPPSSSPHADPQAGGPQRRPPKSTLDRVRDRPSIARRLPSHSTLPRASHQGLLPQLKQKELR